MKLFVVGENTPNPEEWSSWSEAALVIANSEEQAKKLAGVWDGEKCHAIDLDVPKLLMKMPEPKEDY